MVASLTVYGSAGRITGQAAFERGGLDPLVELERRIEWRACAAIGNQFDGLEQAAPADIADVPVIAEALGQPPLEVPPSSFTRSSRYSSPMIRCTSSAAAQAIGCAR